MSRKYYDYLYLGTGKVGFSFPGFSAQDDGVVAFAQADPIVRVEVATAGAAWLDVDIAATPGAWAGGDPLDCSQHIAVAQGQTVYVPMAEVIKAAIVRTFTGITATPDAPCVELTVDFTLYDSSLAALETISVMIYAYYSLGNPATLMQDWRMPGIPDKMRLMLDFNNYMTFPCMQIMQSGYSVSFVQYLSSGSHTDYVTEIDGSSRVFKIPSSYAVHATSFAYRRDDGDMPILYSTQVEWCECSRDKLTLLWWSPELGGWKTMVADIVGTADGVAERSPMERAFCKVDGVAGTLSFAARFPLLTLRDYMYYRDIMLSDEVYVVETDTVSYDGTAAEIRKAVRVSGSLPAWRVNDVKDFEFTINYDYTNEL